MIYGNKNGFFSLPFSITDASLLDTGMEEKITFKVWYGKTAS